MRTEGSPLSHEGILVLGTVGDELASGTTKIKVRVQ